MISYNRNYYHRLPSRQQRLFSFGFEALTLKPFVSLNGNARVTIAIKYIFALKKFYRIKTKQTFTILLWFYVLSVWLAFLLRTTKTYLARRIVQKRRKKLSVVRYFAEAIQLELFTSWKQQFF